METKRLWAIAGLTAALGATPANAETLESYTQRLAEHPQVAKILEQSTRFKELSDGEMGLPDPQIIFGAENVPINNPAFDRFLPTSKVLGIQQQIPSYSLRKARSDKQGRLAKRQSLVADYTRKRLESILIAQLTELDKVKTLEGLAREQLELYRSMEEDMQGQLEAGSPVYGRFSEIDVDRAGVEQHLNDLKAEHVAIEEELVRLVGEVPSIPLPSVPEVTWNRDGTVLYPVRIAAEDVQVATKDVDVADAAFGPTYGVQAIYKQRESGRGFSGDDWLSVQATVSIPLWATSNQKPKLRAAQAERRSAKYAYEDVRREWVGRMATLRAERDVALDNIALLQEKASALQEKTEAAERDYESGNTSLESVLETQIDALTIAAQLAEQKSRHIRLSAQFNSHIVERRHESD
ncbi:MAG: TolC family protein [Gammaproteobacteria bacterium]|nr:TolC family protein [Gammaproteobacteria bacterium]